MAPPFSHRRPEEVLQGGLPRRRVRLHHHPHLSLRPDWLHGLLQGRQPQCQGAPPLLDTRGGGEAVPLLQPGHSPRQLCPAQLRPQGSGQLNGSYIWVRSEKLG